MELQKVKDYGVEIDIEFIGDERICRHFPHVTAEKIVEDIKTKEWVDIPENDTYPALLISTRNIVCVHSYTLTEEDIREDEEDEEDYRW